VIEALSHLGLVAPRVLDLGGHVGQFAIEAKATWPLGHITSVEANLGVIEDLARWADDVYYALLWDEDDVEQPYWMRLDDAYGGSTGNSVYRENTAFFDDLEVKKGIVRCEKRRTVTLDTLLAGQEPYQFVKLDLQGAELKAIQGGTRTFRGVQAILCEQQRKEYNCGAPMHWQVDAAIKRLGAEDGEPDTFRMVWESDHDIVGAMQVDRLYVKVNSDVDLRMRMEGEFKEVIGVKVEEART
jgi:FkbM family methyltransferase